MICAKCDRDLTLCICEDADARIDSLKGSPFLAIDWERIQAQRFLNRFEIERARAAAKEAKPV